MRQRGAVPVVVLVVVAALGLWALVPTWHLPAWLKAKPKVVQLQAADQDLAKAQAAAAQAARDLATAQAAAQAAQLAQLRYAQQMVAGVGSALSTGAASPETVLAKSLVARADNALALAIGKLPADQQAEMQALISQALSAKQAEVDAAMAQLAAKDAQLNLVNQSKIATEAKIPALEKAVADTQVQVAEKEVVAQKAQAQVVQYAKDKAAVDQKNGSLSRDVTNCIRILVVIAILYLIFHYVFPSLAAEFPAASWLSSLYRFFTSLVSAHTVVVPPKS